MSNVNDEFTQFSLRFSQLVENSQGRPFAFDYSGMRTLHFDSRFIQSAMRIDAPNELLLNYTKSMMAFLLVKPEPRHILMIGLGGGSLAKYCYHKLPSTRVTVLESNEGVIALRDTFHVPPDDERFRVVHADAARYVETIAQAVDLIVHDGYDADGLAPAVCGQRFYAACRRALDPDGLMVCNLLGDSDALLPSMLDLYAVFGHALWWGDAQHCYNRIVLAHANAAAMPPQAELMRRARRLEHEGHALALGGFAARLRCAYGAPKADFEKCAAYDPEAAFAAD
jgi:spermidine synthase